MILKNLIRRKLRTAFSIAGVGVGMSLMVAMFSVSSDFLTQIIALLSGARGDIIGLEVRGNIFSSTIPLQGGSEAPLLDRLRKEPNLERVTPHIEAFMDTRERIAGSGKLVYYGVVPDSPVLAPLRPIYHVAPGEPLFVEGDADGFVVGRLIFELANERLPPEKKLRVGQRLNLKNLLMDEFSDYFVDPNSDFANLPVEERLEMAKSVLRNARIDPVAAMQMDNLYLRAVVESDQRIAEAVIYFPLQRAQELTGRPDSCAILILDAQDDSPEALDKTVERLNSRYSNLLFQRSDQFLDTIEEINLIKSFMWGISAIAAIAGALGVLNIMVMAVHERTREIGLLLAVGWSKRKVISGILAEGMLVTLCGGVLGIGLGQLELFALRNLLSMEVLTTWIDPLLSVYALLLSLVLGFLASLYPAWRASRLTPMDALRQD